MRKGVNANVIFALALSVLAFAIMGIIVVVGQVILGGVAATQTGVANQVAANITANATAGLTNVSLQLPLLGTITVFGAVIALLLAVFWFKGKGVGMMANIYGSMFKFRKGINANVIFALALAVLAFVIMAIITSISASILVGVNSTTTVASAQFAANNATQGVMNIGLQLPLLGTILVFGAVITLLLAVFWFRNKGAM